MITADQLYARAKQLETENDEVIQRECLKIAYYAVLHKIQETCEQQNIPLAERLHSGTHEHFIDRINQSYSGKLIANMARVMKRIRIKADYALNENISQDEIEKQLKLANECWYRLTTFTPS